MIRSKNSPCIKPEALSTRRGITNVLLQARQYKTMPNCRDLFPRERLKVCVCGCSAYECYKAISDVRMVNMLS